MFSFNLETWLIFKRCLVRIPGTIHIRCYYIGGFTPLGLLDVVLVGWIGWVLVSTCYLGVHVCLAPPKSCTVEWVLLSLGWVCEYFLCPGVDGTS